MRKYLIEKLKALRQLFVTCRFFCGHLQWVKTGNTLGSKLHEHKCLKCGKSIYRDSFNPPVSFVENGR
jgi:hypothetical protein